MRSEDLKRIPGKIRMGRVKLLPAALLTVTLLFGPAGVRAEAASPSSSAPAAQASPQASVTQPPTPSDGSPVLVAQSSSSSAAPESVQTILQENSGATSTEDSSAGNSAEGDADDTVKGSFLVIYPDSLSGTDRDNLSAAAAVLTSLGDTADYVPAKKAAGALDDYDNIIWLPGTAETSDTSGSGKAEDAETGTAGAAEPGTPDAAASAAEPDAAGEAETNEAGASSDKHQMFLGSVPEWALQDSGATLTQSSAGESGAEAVYTFSGTRMETSVSLQDPVFLTNKEYEEGTVRIGSGSYPLASGWGNDRYLALQAYGSDFARALLTQEITLWQWPYLNSPHSYTEYVVLDEVYPFTDPDRLLKLVESMAEKKMNYVISVMPIYKHADYPAFQQFCEVLKYAQASGGAVILHSPLIQNGVDDGTLQDQLTTATENYFAMGVYPLALSIPSDWIFNDELHDTLGRYRTLFLEDMDAFEGREPSDLSTAKFLSLGSQLITPAIPLDHTGAGYLDCCATAVYLNIDEKDDEIAAAAAAVRDSSIPMQPLWDMNQTVYLNKGGYLFWDGSTLEVDGSYPDLTYRPEEYPENFDYKRNVYYRATADLAGQNRVLIIFSCFVLVLFVLLGIRSRKDMRRKFILPDDSGFENGPGAGEHEKADRKEEP